MAHLRTIESRSSKIEIDSIVVKIASKCNLNCDYCYMYQHADQSYKKQPRVLSDAHSIDLARQIDYYLTESNLDHMNICLHGGEPLLAGLKRIEKFLSLFKTFFKDRISFSIQTNGTLLTKAFLDLFRNYAVKVSLSLDGPKQANDKHRLDHKRLSSYEKVEKAIEQLSGEYKDLFSGIISVIDPSNHPEEIIKFFASINPPSYDLLFPDATHYTSPPGRSSNSMLYVNWICRAFTYWYKYHPHLQVRTFMNVCDGVLGKDTETELFGNGSVSYIVVETDGGYHYSDMLKVAYEGASNTGLFVHSNTIMEVVQSPVIQKFESLLTHENKCQTCLNCSEYKICGSGQIVHRYGPKGFHQPTVYCDEMFSMIRTARHLIFEARAKEFCAYPHLYAAEIAEAFLNDQSIYLLTHILDWSLLLDTARIIPKFLFHEDIPDKIGFQGGELFLEKDKERLKKHKSLLLKSFHAIQCAFPFLYREFLFLLRHIFFIKDFSANRLQEGLRFSQSMTKESIDLYLFVDDMSNIFYCIRLVLSAFLEKKLLVFSQKFLLFKTYDETTFKRFSSVYIDSHLFRISQFLIVNDGFKIEDNVSELLSSLIENTGLLKPLDFSDVGRNLLEKIINEFIPCQMGSLSEHKN